MPLPENTPIKKQLEVAFGGYSSAGLKAENQDAFIAHFPDGNAGQLKGAVACIADGVSCSDNAQLASQTSVTTFVEDYFSTPDTWSVKTAAARVLSSLNAWLFHHGQQGKARHNGLVSTFSAMILKSTSAHFFHVGDSRIYRYRGHKQGADLEQLSRDHTHQQGAEKTFLTRALGMDSHLEVDYLQEELKSGDLLMLSTDGVHENLSTKQLKAFLETASLPLQSNQESTRSTLESLARDIVERAEAQGSADNNSCLLVQVLQLPEEDIDEAFRRLTQLKIPPALGIGMKLDGFCVDKILHAGTRSHVYRVTREDKEGYWVLKTPSENFSEDAEYLEAFIREQWVGRRIDHPGVMKIHSQEQVNSPFLYHICEYIEGQTLRQWIFDHPQASLEDVRDIVEQLIAAMRAFQRMSMVHRDLKPENIILTKDNKIKIIDFGTVQVSGLEEIASPLTESCPVGAVDYIAPEYLLGEKGQFRSDIFSLGVIVYEMLTGALPYKKPRVQRNSERSYDLWQYQPAINIRSDLPQWVDLCLQKATAPRPSQRHNALSEFMQDLTRPNKALMAKVENAPLLERDPLGFWKLVSAVLLVALVVQAWLQQT